MKTKNQEIFNKLENQERESIERLVIQRTEIEQQDKISETVAVQTETLFKQGTRAEIAQLDKSVDAFFSGGSSVEKRRKRTKPLRDFVDSFS